MAAKERQTDNGKVKPIFCELSANDSEPEVTEIESLCMDCGKNVYNLYFIYFIYFLSKRLL